MMAMCGSHDFHINSISVVINDYNTIVGCTIYSFQQIVLICADGRLALIMPA